MALKVKMKVKPLLEELHTLRDQFQEGFYKAEEQWKRDMDIYLAEVRQAVYNMLKSMEADIDWQDWSDGTLEVPWDIQKYSGRVMLNLELEAEKPRRPDPAFRLAAVIRLLERTSQEEIWVEENSDIDKVIKEHLK